MNYRILLTFDQDRQLFRAYAPELEHCAAEAADRGEAVKKLEEEIREQLKVMADHGKNPPKAIDDTVWNGEVKATLSSTLHKDLVWQARREGIPLDQYVTELLMMALESKRKTSGTQNQGQNQRQDGNRPQRDPSRARSASNYHGDLDDRANFMQYLRNTEAGHDNQQHRKPKHQKDGRNQRGGNGGRQGQRRPDRQQSRNTPPNPSTSTAPVTVDGNSTTKPE